MNTTIMDNGNSLYNIQDLIIKYLSGNASAQEKEIIHQWIHLSEENKEEFVKMKSIWMATAQFNASHTNTNDALARLNRRIDSGNKVVPLGYQVKRFVRIAAIFISTFMFGALGSYLVLKNKPVEQKAGLVSVFAPKGAKALTVLPDGTEVWLNAGSRLCYDVSVYGETTRQVALSGEAFFKVVSNAEKPFIVSAKDLKIKALGTEFNVKAYPEEDIVETILVEGVVKVEGKNQDRKSFVITMNPKQKVTIYAGKETSTPTTASTTLETNKQKEENPIVDKTDNPVIDDEVRTDLYTSWKDERWIIEGEEIGDLAVKLERRFNIKIDIKSEELKHYKFTGIFQNETIEQVLKVLKLTTPLEYTIGKGEIELVLDPDSKNKYRKYMNTIF